MTGKAIFACMNPSGACWQLGPLPPTEGEVMLLGWNLPSKPIDSGIPENVGALLASTFISIARVSFLVSEVPYGASKKLTCNDEDQVQILGVCGLLERTEAMLKRIPSSFTLLSTRRKETAIRLFDDVGYPWTLQGQIALLSKPDIEPPCIDRHTLLSITGNNWVQHANRLRSIGVFGVLRPGIDGDIACVLSLTDEFKRAFLDALTHAAELAKFDWRLVSEKEFIDRV
jgi:hypothetical protein